jgi:VanZ family protein
MTPGWRRRTIGAVAAAYLVGALVVGFWPTTVDTPSLDGMINLTLARLHADGLPRSFGFDAVQAVANVLFFIPIGLLVYLLLPPRRWYLAIVIGMLGSGTIELGQLLFRPHRVASWEDVATNSIGTAVGVAIVLAMRGVRRRGQYRAQRRGSRRISPASPATSATRPRG